MDQSPFAKLDPAALLREMKAETTRIEALARQLQTFIDEALATRNRWRLVRFFNALQDAPKPIEGLLEEHRKRLGTPIAASGPVPEPGGLASLSTAGRRIETAAGQLRAELERTKPEQFEPGGGLAMLLRLKEQAAGVKDLSHWFRKGAPANGEAHTPTDDFVGSMAEIETELGRIEALLMEIRGALDEAVDGLGGQDLNDGGPSDVGPILARFAQAGVDLKYTAHDLKKSLHQGELSRRFDAARQRSRIRTLCLAEIFPGIDKVSLPVGAVNEFGGHPNKVDLLFVSAIAKYRQARNIFEFGTYTGRTTYHLTLASEEARVTTLNLPPELETRLAPYLMTYYRGSDREGRITQLFEDSRDFDPAPFAGQYDFIFVDADHSYELVKIDTEKALTMLAPQGMLVWHDYAPKSPGVVQFMEEFSKERPVFHIRNTCLTLWIDGVDAEAFDPAPMPPSAEYDAITARERALKAAQ